MQVKSLSSILNAKGKNVANYTQPQLKRLTLGSFMSALLIEHIV